MKTYFESGEGEGEGVGESLLMIIQRQIFLFVNENICCDPSLEPSRRDASNDGSQNMFLWRSMAS